MRAMTAADIDAVCAIEQAVQAYPWTRGNFSDALQHGYLCCVDEHAGEIRSYAILMPLVDEAELLTIGVAEHWQRQGLGKAMLLDILHQARQRQLRCVFLEVCSSNQAALLLYLHNEFIQIGQRRGYYQNAQGSEDALVMACDLSENHE